MENKLYSNHLVLTNIYRHTHSHMLMQTHTHSSVTPGKYSFSLSFFLSFFLSFKQKLRYFTIGADKFWLQPRRNWPRAVKRTYFSLCSSNRLTHPFSNLNDHKNKNNTNKNIFPLLVWSRAFQYLLTFLSRMISRDEWNVRRDLGHYWWGSMNKLVNRFKFKLLSYISNLLYTSLLLVYVDRCLLGQRSLNISSTDWIKYGSVLVV